MKDNDKNKGLYRKYFVRKLDENGHPKEDDGDVFFVLNLSSGCPHVKAAILSFANSCKTENIKLHDDLKRLIRLYDDLKKIDPHFVKIKKTGGTT